MGLISERKLITVQGRYEKGLYLATLLIIEIYIQLSIYRYIMDPRVYYLMISILKRCMLVIAIGTAAEHVVMMIRELEQWKQRKQVLFGWCSYEQLFLVFVFLWYIVACIVRHCMFGDDYYESNNLLLFVTFVISFLLFPLARFSGKERAERDIDGLLVSAVIPFAIFSVWLLWHYYHAEYVPLPSGSHLEMESPAILTLSDLNHNIIAQNTLAMLGISVYLCFKRKAARKLLFFLCSVVFAVLLILTNSRNSWFAAVLFLMSCAFLLGWNRLEKENILKLSMCLGLAILAGVFCHWLRREIFVLLKLSLSHVFSSTVDSVAVAGSSAASTAIETTQGASTALQARGYEDLGTVAIRLPLYRASILAMVSSWSNFFFGVTPADVVGTLREYEGVSQTYGYGHAHNYFLQMGIAHGVPAMVGSVIFALSLFVRCFHTVFDKSRSIFCGAKVIALLIISMLAANILECCLSSNPTSANFLCTAFYLLAGWLVAADMDGGGPFIDVRLKKTISPQTRK